MKESEKEKHSRRNRSWDGRKNRKSRGRSWKENARIEKAASGACKCRTERRICRQNLKRIEKEIRNLREEEKRSCRKSGKSLDVIAEKEAQIRQIESRIAGTKDHGRDHGRRCRSFRHKRREKCGTENLFTRRRSFPGRSQIWTKKTSGLHPCRKSLKVKKKSGSVRSGMNIR